MHQSNNNTANRAKMKFLTLCALFAVLLAVTVAKPLDEGEDGAPPAEEQDVPSKPDLTPKAELDGLLADINKLLEQLSSYKKASEEAKDECKKSFEEFRQALIDSTTKVRDAINNITPAPEAR